jgi:hypothetical protein
MLKKVVVYVFVPTLCVFAVIQLVPYGRSHENPPRVEEPAWTSASTRALAVRACFDCHSNETRWPWYAEVAPVSWLVQRDVWEGRRTLNFSEWQREYGEAHEAAEVVLERSMPPRYYSLLHPESRLSPEERRALAQTLASLVRPHSGEPRGDD